MQKTYIKELINAVVNGFTSDVTLHARDGYKIKENEVELVNQDWQTVGQDISAAAKKFEEMTNERK